MALQSLWPSPGDCVHSQNLYTNTTTWSLRPGKPAATFSCLLCQARPIGTKVPGPRATAGRPNGKAGQSRGGELGSSRLFSPCTRCTWRGLSGTTTRSGYTGGSTESCRKKAWQADGRPRGCNGPSSALGCHRPSLELMPHAEHWPLSTQTCLASPVTHSLTTSRKPPGISHC